LPAPFGPASIRTFFFLAIDIPVEYTEEQKCHATQSIEESTEFVLMEFCQRKEVCSEDGLEGFGKKNGFLIAAGGNDGQEEDGCPITNLGHDGEGWMLNTLCCHPEPEAKDLCPGRRCHGWARSFGPLGMTRLHRMCSMRLSLNMH
jgi:hypothetical protein